MALLRVLVVAISVASLCHGKLVYNVLEELPPRAPFGNIVLDAQLDEKYTDGEAALLTFTFLSDPDEDARKRIFAVGETTGILETVDRLDRDVICREEEGDSCEIELSVAVGPAAYFQVINVKIVVEDRNDHVPLFSEARYDVVIPESAPIGESFKLPVATDGDGVQFGIQHYELRPNVPELGLQESANFDGSKELHLVVRKNLDRETLAGYQLQVIAVDGGDPPQLGAMFLNVSVSDVNDSPPVFDKSAYLIELAEDVQHPRLVVRVQASDPDTGRGGSVARYGFSAKTRELQGHLFHINSTSGEVFLMGPLDYEQTEEYQLIVVASDAGLSSPQSAHVVLTVKVTDVNDNSPKITVNTLTDSGEPRVSESADVGSFVAHVSVTDRDNGRNGQVTCTLDDGATDAFRIEQFQVSQYKVVTSRRLDAETRTRYPLTIKCRDRGNPSKVSSVSLVAMVTDSNDHIPVMSQLVYSATLDENNLAGIVLANVTATDGDSSDENNKVSYYLLNNTRNLLTIDADTGVIKTNGQFDHEQEEVVYVQIIAADNGQPSLSSSAMMVVYVKDVNDVAPAFSQEEYTFVIQENQAAPRRLDQVTATDADSPPYNQIRYSLTPDPESADFAELFKVNPDTGDVEIMGVLDREAIPMHRFYIMATDVDNPSLLGNAVVTVYVGDENDNFPAIDFPKGLNNTVHISNKHRVGDHVSKIYAHDLDSGNNGEVRYAIESGNSDGYFVVDPVTGDVIVAADTSEIEYEAFEFLVVVSDNGILQRNTSATLNIVIDREIPVIDKTEPGKEGQSGKAKGSDLISGTNMTVLICVVSISAVIAIILIGAIAFVLLRNRKAKSTGSRRHPEEFLNHDLTKSMDKSHEGENFSDKSLSSDSSYPGSRLSPDGGDITRLWPRAAHSSNKGGNKQGYYPGDLGRRHGGCQSPDGTDAHVTLAVNQSRDSGFEHGSDVMPSKADGNDSAGTTSPAPTAGTFDKKELRAHRLMTFLSRDFDADSACSEEVSNTDSGRDTLNDDVEAQRKDSPDLPQVHSTGAPCNYGVPSSPDGGTTSPSGPLSYSQFSSQFNGSQQQQQGPDDSLPKQTLREVKAKDKSKKQQFWPAEYTPKKAPFGALQCGPKSTEGLAYNVKTGAINPYSSPVACHNFNDASSVLNYKMAGKHIPPESSLDITDDCMSTSTTSGSYVIHLEDSMLDIPDITV